MIMKKQICFLSIFLLFFVSGCDFGKKEEFSQYLKEHDYQEKKSCLQKTNKVDDEEYVQRFCLDECKYYAFNQKLDDFFIMELDSKAIQYIYDYVTYQTDLNGKKKLCFFQGEEIDLNSSYCKNAEMAVLQHIQLFHTEFDLAGFNMKYVCQV